MRSPTTAEIAPRLPGATADFGGLSAFMAPVLVALPTRQFARLS
jgi:hypothetical protein